MHRPRLIGGATLALTLLGLAPAALAADGPSTDLVGLLAQQTPGLVRGPGLYLNLFKFVPVVLLYLLWVYTTHWVERDTRDLNNPRFEMWNSAAFLGGLAGFALLFVIPLYVVGVLALVLCLFGPLFAYIYTRNDTVPEEDKVLTAYHLGEVANGLLRKLGVRNRVFNKAESQYDSAGPPINFIGKGMGMAKEDPSRVEKAEQSAQYMGAKELVYDAILRRATDIHLEPSPEQLAIRYRIDGILHNAEPFDRPTGDAVINIFKILAAMDISEKRKPQDGSFSAKLEGRDIEFRVATSGSKGGEKMVMRLLDNATTVGKLEEIGLRPKMVQTLRQLINQPNGMFLLAGPTGSGKSTTLYACMRDLDRFTRNIITVEDPIEYQIDNITQIEINTKAGQTFGGSLRSILRQDPDVIMIGEIRDQETATIACQAANTGHLVFSTVHANDSITALFRLLDLGVEPYMLSTAVSAILSQRLVRVLCETCKEPYKPKPEFLKKANLPADKVEVFYRPPEAPEEVCPACGGNGYVGRTGIFELLIITDPIRDLLRENPSMNAIKAEARKNGMIYLQEDGLRQVIQGKTSIPELMRVAK